MFRRVSWPAAVVVVSGACSTMETAPRERSEQPAAAVVEEEPQPPADTSTEVPVDPDLAAVKNAIESAESLSTSELSAARRSAESVELQAEKYGPEWPAKIRDLKVRIDHLCVTKTREEATAFAALPTTTPQQGLAKYAAAEDYVRNAVLAAMKARNKADADEFTATYKALVAESDAYAAKVVTPDFIRAVPWKDLLAPDMAARWSKSSRVPGFAMTIDDGVLTASPPDPGSKQLAMIGIFDQKTDDLRNFVLEMEFAVEGTVTMFFHLSPAPGFPDGRQSHSYDLVAGDNALKPGRKYAMQAVYVGSSLVVEFPTDTHADDDIAKWEADKSWAKLRKGGIAFLIPEGARLKITRMRIKELR